MNPSDASPPFSTESVTEWLGMLTERKAIGVRRREQAEKRGGGEVRGESALEVPNGSWSPGMGQVAGAEPTPEFAAQMAEDFAQRLATLGEQPQLQQIACDKMAGYTNTEIAQRLDGRSDIWNLGVILYELLTGRRPFHGATRDELFDEIKHRDATPPRQRQPQVPVELDRICLKCLKASGR